MKIAVFYPSGCGLSLRCYTENISKELLDLGVELVMFSKRDPLPERVDLYWDPRAGRGGPCRKLWKAKKPCVVTFHGAASCSPDLSLLECFGTLRAGIQGWMKSKVQLFHWRLFRNRLGAIVCVSKYAKAEAQQVLANNAPMYPIHHGVNQEIFHIETSKKVEGEPYFLHVSSYKPIKNIGRIIAAYTRLLQASKPRLLLVSPGHTFRTAPEGVQLIGTSLSHHELGTLYRNAIAFVFPSLRESFGLPILEAMACGCPVITSDCSSCPEVAGNAALLVNPRSVGEITKAMERLVEDRNLREDLRQKGLERVKNFTWRKSALKHLEVFQKVLQGR